jgi:uncharacterized protein YaaN involved in tellurite resistance
VSTSDDPSPAEPIEGPPGSVSPQESGAAPRLALSPAAVERVEQTVAQVVDSIVAAAPEGHDYQRLVGAVEHLAEHEFLATAAMSGRVLDRRFRSMDSLLTGKAPMARRLAELRKAADELDPERLKPGKRRSSDAEMRELDRYFARFRKVQPRLESILAELTRSRFVLEQDNASIAGEQATLSAEMDTLREYAFLAERLDGALDARVSRIAPGDPDRADRLRADVLVAVRRRRNEILIQLAIATQGYAALRIVEDSNAEMLGAVASAIDTTSAALRTAILAAQAAASQRLALEHIEAARRAQGVMEDQASALEAGMAARASETEALAAAWSEMRAALDRVEDQKARALRSISSADRELTRPKPR